MEREMIPAAVFPHSPVEYIIKCCLSVLVCCHSFLWLLIYVLMICLLYCKTLVIEYILFDCISTRCHEALLLLLVVEQIYDSGTIASAIDVMCILLCLDLSCRSVKPIGLVK